MKPHLHESALRENSHERCTQFFTGAASPSTRFTGRQCPRPLVHDDVGPILAAVGRAGTAWQKPDTCATGSVLLARAGFPLLRRAWEFNSPVVRRPAGSLAPAARHVSPANGARHGSGGWL